MITLLAGAFDEFNPLIDAVPIEPFASLPSMASRARDVLCFHDIDGAVTFHQIEVFLAVADDYICEYFESEAEITNDEAYDADGEIQFGDVNPDNTSFIEALKEMVVGEDLVSVKGVGDVSPALLFAVLALTYIGSAIASLALESHATPNSKALIDSRNMENIRHRTQAANEVILGMEALSYAESLLAIDDAQASIVESLSRGATPAVVAQLVKEARSKSAKAAANIKNKENQQMKRDVFEWCSANISKFDSMDRAAEAIAGTGKLVPVTFRTARDWIGQWAKAQRSARKP
jgi:hypothetical protein